MQVRYLRPAKQMPEIYLYRAPVDFRKQANGLALLIEQELGYNPFSSAMYAFTNRQHNKIKCIMWKDNGRNVSTCFVMRDGSNFTTE